MKAEMRYLYGISQPWVKLVSGGNLRAALAA